MCHWAILPLDLIYLRLFTPTISVFTSNPDELFSNGCDLIRVVSTLAALLYFNAINHFKKEKEGIPTLIKINEILHSHAITFTTKLQF